MRRAHDNGRAGNGRHEATSPAAVKVRMYRQGLGDCFLLSFPTRSRSRPFYMMIDCGVLLGTEGATETMREVLEDISETTDGQLDLLVVTHEHWDHLSGFVQARDVFEGLRVRQLWLAWTEDPANKFARMLRDRRDRKVEALRKAVVRLRAIGARQGRLARALPMNREDRPMALDAADRTVKTAGRLRRVLKFFGAARRGTGLALKIVRDRAETIQYRHPGEAPIPLPGVDGVRIYVLGPPENELIKRSDPTRTGREVYEMALGLDPSDEGFLKAVEDDGGAEPEPGAPGWPFDECLRVSEAEASRQRFFQGHYFGAGGGDDWRRIDGDWLGAAGPLALRLDNDTNNTSLALAIELVGSGKVLLFPGDAQVGNWLSWEALHWKGPDGGRVTAADLLRRTVLYKVGHHASHNATLRAKGLELMQSPELVAMIPVDRDMAEKKGWDMPFPDLLERLREKTSGRIIRADEGVGHPTDDLPPSQWKEFVGRVESRESDRWIEYTIPLHDRTIAAGRTGWDPATMAVMSSRPGSSGS